MSYVKKKVAEIWLESGAAARCRCRWELEVRRQKSGVRSGARRIGASRVAKVQFITADEIRLLGAWPSGATRGQYAEEGPPKRIPTQTVATWRGSFDRWT